MTQQSDLYFFDQCFKRRKYKRYRKPQELLPFSLRLTGLSGAVKVEAYLKQQQQKAGEGREGLQHAKGLATEKGNEVSESPSRLGLLHRDHEGDIDGVKKLHGGKAFNLPEIAAHGVHSPPAIRSYEQLEGDDDEEDTQRFLFEENKFAAPNLLAQLGRLIDQLHEQQLEELDEIRSSNGQFDDRSATPPLEPSQSLVFETIRSGGVVIPLPDDLPNKLRGNFEELSANAVLVRREWQTTSYREQAILQKRLGIMSDSQTNVDHSKSHEKSDLNKASDDKSAAVIRSSESKDLNKRKQSTVAESSSKLDSTGDQRRESLLGVNTPTTDISHTEIPSRRESSRLSFVQSVQSRPKTRLERFKLFSEKAANGRWYVVSSVSC